MSKSYRLLTTFRLADKMLTKTTDDFLDDLYARMGTVAVVFTARILEEKHPTTQEVTRKVYSEL